MLLVCLQDLSEKLDGTKLVLLKSFLRKNQAAGYLRCQNVSFWIRYQKYLSLTNLKNKKKVEF